MHVLQFAMVVNVLNHARSLVELLACIASTAVRNHVILVSHAKMSHVA
jgi:hypothetical protein